MKTAKLVLGIFSIVICVYVLFQSFLAGLINTIRVTGESSGTGGMFLSMLMLAGGIVGIAGKKSRSCAITCTILYFVASVIGFLSAGTLYRDLYIGSYVCFAFFAFYFVSIWAQQYDGLSEGKTGKEPYIYEVGDRPIDPTPPKDNTDKSK